MDQEEKQVIEFWEKSRIYEKIKAKNKKGKKFYLMDGPPYATGHIHMGTALNKVLKDIVMRHRRLQGFNVFDRPGYDTHGVPIEYQIEKEIGSKSKKDIEKYGIKKFIEKCKQFATQYIEVMNKEFENLGVWMDWSNPYLTLSDDYIEAIWWTFKKAEEKGLLYLGKYPIHVCPRCETAVAYNEIIYSKQDDNSVYVKFPLNKEKKKFLLIWTTTPWTLPGNTGVMVNPEFDYAEMELSNGEVWIMAEQLVAKIMSQLGLGYTIKKVFKGKELEGLEYTNPLSKNLNVKTKNAYKVVLSSRYVNLDDGTGLVHCAPGHGKEDYEVGKEYKLDALSPVDISGTLTQEAGKYAGKKARVVDAEIIKDLEESENLVYKHVYSHDYPLCWRCKSPLLMISLPQWFFKIDDIHGKLLKFNEETNWTPSWMKLRMKAWLEGISDWPISRKRYWGTPLPIWICQKCNQKKVIGSIDELKKLSGQKIISVHKPEIDEIKIKCKCGGEMERIEEVLDVWFDSGVSSWAALGFPHDKKNFSEFWPADINIEGKDQVRGWWNSQLILSTIAFDKKPYESIMVHGMVMDISKRKMSKSLGNVISPQEIIDKYGRDYLRYYFAKISKGEDFSFDEKELQEIRKTFTILQNVVSYAIQAGNAKKPKNMALEDKWILSRLNSVIKEANENYNNYNLHKAVEIIESFLVNEISRGYIKLIRERADKKEPAVLYSLNLIIESLLKLFAPIIPFMSETNYQKLKDAFKLKEESVHLCGFPEADKKMIDEKLEKEIETVNQLVRLILAEREKEKIGVRWPLGKADITMPETIRKEAQELILRQCNIKKINIKKGKLTVKLDTKMTPELEAEGYAREIIRRVQDARKKEGMQKQQKIDLLLMVDEKLKKMLKKHEKMLAEKTNSEKFKIENVDVKKARADEYARFIETEIRDKKVILGFNIL